MKQHFQNDAEWLIAVKRVWRKINAILIIIFLLMAYIATRVFFK